MRKMEIGKRKVTLKYEGWEAGIDGCCYSCYS
jgi:hypothetical protein